MDLQSPPAFCLLAGLATPSSIQSCFPEAKVKRSLRFAATLPGFLTLEGLICYRLQQTAASVAVVSNAALVLPGGVNNRRVWTPNSPPARRTRYLLLPQAFGTRGSGTWLPALLCAPPAWPAWSPVTPQGGHATPQLDLTPSSRMCYACTCQVCGPANPPRAALPVLPTQGRRASSSKPNKNPSHCNV